MKLVTQTDCTAKTFGPYEAVDILSRAGYDGIDWSFFELTGSDSIWLENDWRGNAQKIRRQADDAGVQIIQAHAPFPSSKGESSRGDEGYESFIFKRILRSMEAASILGVKFIVVHPKHHLVYRNNRKATWDMNIDFYRSLIPYCEKWNIHVCAENMWQYNKQGGFIVDSFLSEPEEFCDFLDALDSPWIVGCLDLGHSALVGVEPQDFIRAMGPDRIKALHVHDVDYHADCHTLPYMESLNWAEITRALGETGYSGTFTFEADNFLNKLPKELRKDGIEFMCKTGRYLVRQVEKWQQKD